MNCHAIAAILDEHRSARLTAAERGTVDEHLLACADCAATWHAQMELGALRLPPAPAALLERTMGAVRARAGSERRSSRAPLFVASIALTGAALAAVTIVSVSRRDAEPLVPTAAVVPATQPSAPAGAPLRSDDAPPNGAPVRTSTELVETALSLAPMVRRPPDYPPLALDQGLEGHVQVRFDVTAAGVVENVSAVESSDPLFEDAAVRAVAKWRYLPRIAAGKRVATSNVDVVVRFALTPDQRSAAPRRAQDAGEFQRNWLAFSADLEVAVDRLAADDLRGAELQLDEMSARYGSDAFPGDLSSFYGYLFTVQGNYDRAIDAYETALAAYARAGSPAGPRVPLANLYFARHQYDMALKTLLRPRRADGPARLSAEGEALVQRLRALGVTEETLAPSR